MDSIWIEVSLTMQRLDDVSLIEPLDAKQQGVVHEAQTFEELNVSSDNGIEPALLLVAKIDKIFAVSLSE